MISMNEKTPKKFISQSDGLTSINQLIDNSANDIFSFSDTSSATERILIIPK